MDARICDEHFVLNAVDQTRIVAITGKSQYGSFERLDIVIVDSQMLGNQKEAANSLVWLVKVFKSVMFSSYVLA